jgi:hypothetical protein
VRPRRTNTTARNEKRFRCCPSVGHHTAVGRGCCGQEGFPPLTVPTRIPFDLLQGPGVPPHAAANGQGGIQPSISVLVVPAPASFYTANGQRDRIIIRDNNAAGLNKNKQKNSFPCSSRSFTTSPVFWMLSPPRRRRTGHLSHSRVAITTIYEPRKGMINTRRASSRTMAPPGGRSCWGRFLLLLVQRFSRGRTLFLWPYRMTRPGRGIQQNLLVDCLCLHSIDGWIDRSRSLLRNVSSVPTSVTR